MNELTKPLGRLTTGAIVQTGLFAAILAILSQVSVTLPSGVPVTLQTFAVALTGVVLSWKLGTVSTLLYILLGAIGIPVFAGFSGGVQVLVNYTGGFIWGFIVLALLCGIGVLCKNKALGIICGCVGLFICHVFGIVQFMIVMKMGFGESFLIASAPYLVKDVISVILGFVVGASIRARLIKAGLL
ncbi:MAG: biotin transporter BioY [Blautia sp.]|nr:biotin transporter BioY [Lachnoclostridium sp.]MCM1212440.1 biotin transporter BioY [Blautia sp.]